MEIIRSRSAVETQLATHRATLPFLEGTKPPVALPVVEPEDSFLDATIEELASFVVQKLDQGGIFAPETRPEQHFFILDAKTLLEGSIILVNISDANYQEDSDSEIEEMDQEDGDDVRRFRLAGEKVGMRYGKMRKGNDKISAVRIGLAIGAKWAETLEQTSCDIDGFKMECAKDGAFWETEYRGKSPPPIEERAGMKEVQ